MAEVKFSKGSEEWMMFMEYWNLCQKYWKIEKDDNYWDSLVKETNSFYEKYKSIKLSKRLAMALMETQEEKYKDMKG